MPPGCSCGKFGGGCDDHGSARTRQCCSRCFGSEILWQFKLHSTEAGCSAEQGLHIQGQPP